MSSPEREKLVVVVGPDSTIEIPQVVRESFDVEVGQKMAWLAVGKSYRLVKVKTLTELRGSLGPFDTSDYRDETDRA